MKVFCVALLKKGQGRQTRRGVGESKVARLRVLRGRARWSDWRGVGEFKVVRLLWFCVLRGAAEKVARWSDCGRWAEARWSDGVGG